MERNDLIENEEACYLLVKRGLYYRPERLGYTGAKAEAGRYTLADAAELINHGVSLVHEDNAEEFTSSCPEETKIKHMEATIASLSEALAEAEKKGAEVERLAEFARGIIRDSAWQGCDLDGAEVQERALKAGLLRSENFDPAVHEDVEGYAEPGMEWFVFSGPLAPPRDLSQGGQP